MVLGGREDLHTSVDHKRRRVVDVVIAHFILRHRSSVDGLRCPSNRWAAAVWAFLGSHQLSHAGI